MKTETRNVTFTGGDIRRVLGNTLSDEIGIDDSMQFNSSSLKLFLRSALSFASLRDIVRVDHYGDSTKGTIRRWRDVPNLLLKDVHGVNHYMRATPVEELTWGNTWSHKLALLKILISLGIEHVCIRLNLDITDEVICREMSSILLLPDFGFEYNFTTNRFSIKLPNGLTIRKVKQSSYPEWCRGIKVVVTIGTNEQYGVLLGHGGINLAEWLPANSNERTLLLDGVASMARAEMARAGWCTDVSITTDDELFSGVIARYEAML